MITHIREPFLSAESTEYENTTWIIMSESFLNFFHLE